MFAILECNCEWNSVVFPTCCSSQSALSGHCWMPSNVAWVWIPSGFDHSSGGFWGVMWVMVANYHAPKSLMCEPSSEKDKYVWNIWLSWGEQCGISLFFNGYINKTHCLTTAKNGGRVPSAEMRKFRSWCLVSTLVQPTVARGLSCCMVRLCAEVGSLGFWHQNHKFFVGLWGTVPHLFDEFNELILGSSGNIEGSAG